MGNLYGIALCLLIALPAHLAGRRFPLAGGPVIAILAGIALSAAFPRIMAPRPPRSASAAAGVRFTSKKLLQYSIVLLGFDMNLFNILRAGGMSLAVLFFTFLAAFLTAWCAGKLLRLPAATTILIGVGTSICGGSAIAAAAPVIRAGDEDVSRAVSTIFLFNVIAVFIFPPLGRLMGMSDTNFGMWAGTAINDTSSVAAAGAAWSAVSGNSAALDFAVIVKLTRALMIVPVTLALAIYTARKHGRGGGAFTFAKVFPWFTVFFLAAAVVNTAFRLPAGAAPALAHAGKFLIVMAMAAIGLNTSVKSLLTGGVKPLILGVSCWAAVALASLAAQRLTGL